jgi:hypothetical protein
MLPGLTLPASLAGLLWSLRPVFTGPSYRTFCGLVAGLAGHPARPAGHRQEPISRPSHDTR